MGWLRRTRPSLETYADTCLTREQKDLLWTNKGFVLANYIENYGFICPILRTNFLSLISISTGNCAFYHLKSLNPLPVALAGMAPWVRASSCKQKIAGLILGQGACKRQPTHALSLHSSLSGKQWNKKISSHKGFKKSTKIAILESYWWISSLRSVCPWTFPCTCLLAWQVNKLSKKRKKKKKHKKLAFLLFVMLAKLYDTSKKMKSAGERVWW